MVGPTHHLDPILHWLCWAQNIPFCFFVSLLSLAPFSCVLFLLLILRSPSLPFLLPLPHNLVVLFCTHNLLDHCITNCSFFGLWLLFIMILKLLATLVQRFIMENHSPYFSFFVVVVSYLESKWCIRVVTSNTFFLVKLWLQHAHFAS
jgi:hypothetical protein